MGEVKLSIWLNYSAPTMTTMAWLCQFCCVLYVVLYIGQFGELRTTSFVRIPKKGHKQVKNPFQKI